MIWIFENLSTTELEDLERLNPLMDMENDGLQFLHQTFCDGFEIRDGMLQDIRKIRFFTVKQTKQGFISDDFEEARELSRAIIRGDGEDQIFNKYPEAFEYYRDHDIQSFTKSRIALSVVAFIRGATQNHPQLLDNLSLDLLKKYGIDITEYIPIKRFHSGDIIFPQQPQDE